MSRADRPRIVILTGTVHSGKTTHLATLVDRAREDDVRVAGILAPVINGVRHLRLIPSGEARPLEIDDAEAARIPERRRVTIGPYTFDDDVFAWARTELRSTRETVLTAASAGPDWIIVDEIGPLELHGAALEPEVGALVDAVRQRRGPGILLVVRDGLVDRVLDHLGIDREAASVVTREELAELA